MFTSRFMPCEHCGESVERTSAESHTCDAERKVEFEMFRMRLQIANFESHFHTYLDQPRGLFESWLAARAVRRTP